MRNSTIMAAASSRALLGTMTAGERRLGRYMRDGEGHPPGAKSVSEMATEIKAGFERKFEEVKGLAEKAVAEAQKGVDQTSAQKEIIDGALISMNEAKERLDQLEQKLARAGGPEGDDRSKSVGERFSESDSFKALAASAGQRGKAGLEVKATITSLATDAAGSAGDAVRPSRLAGIDPLPRRTLTVRDLISPGTMDGSSIEYVQQTGFTRNAGMVAEGTKKPQSDIKLDLKNAPARVIAHFMKASRQILDDAPALRSLIDEELLYGLALKEESQLLNGDGAGQNLLGIVPQATAYSAPIALTSPTSIDQIRLMMLQASLAEYPASGIVMHPADWAWIETLKDGQGRYLIGNPQDGATPRLWRLPVVETQAMSIDKVLVGAFKGGAQVFDRWQARIELATENEDDFVNNLVTVLAEERLALAVKRPEAFIYGDFGRVT